MVWELKFFGEQGWRRNWNGSGGFVDEGWNLCVRTPEWVAHFTPECSQRATNPIAAPL